jgi:hypothetical protein
MTRRWWWTLGLLLLAALPGPAAAALRGEVPAEIGVLLPTDPELPGAAVEPGEVLRSPALVQAFSTPAIVRLDNGRVLKLDANTSAILTARSGDRIELKVLSGGVAIAESAERILWGGAPSVFVLDASADDPLAAESVLLGPSPAAQSARAGHRALRSPRTPEAEAAAAAAEAAAGSVKLEVRDDR